MVKMQKLKTKSFEFNVDSVVDLGDVLEITFASGVTYMEVSGVYDPYNNEMFQIEELRRFELFGENGEHQGVHMGYTETHDISAFGGVVKVKIKQEDKLKTEVELLKQQNAILHGAVSELTMIVAMSRV